MSKHHGVQFLLARDELTHLELLATSGRSTLTGVDRHDTLLTCGPTPLVVDGGRSTGRRAPSASCAAT
jgi:hypothetical protein